MKPRLGGLLALALTLLAAPAAGQDGLPLEPARTLDFTVSGGTFTSLAVSPDGRTILFDMLGEIYAVPATGGRAVPIATGIAFEVQPVFSPDGKWIAYVSDRSGGDNVWIARADGSEARRITDEDEGAVRTSPEWSADGKSIYVSRYRIRLDRYELWRHPVDGGPGELVAPARATADAPRAAWQSTLGAAASRDGRWLYYARHVGDLSFDAPVAWTIVRRDLATGAEETVIGSSGGRGSESETFFRPAISPDGRMLAYATRHLAETRLRVRDLTTGVDRDLGPAPLDLMNGAAWLDLIPRYAFTPDGKAILIAWRGRIERRLLDGAPATPIPFTARLQLAVGPSTRVAIEEPRGPVRAKLLQGTAASPDGARVAYAALGSLYVQGVDGGAARRLPIAGDPPSLPGWSPDGTRLVYVTWSEKGGGAIWTIAADGSAAPVKISDIPAFYSHAVFTPDGARILAVRSPAAARQHSSFEFGTVRAADLVAFPAAGGAARVVTSGTLGQRPHFVVGEPDTAYLMSDAGLIAVDLASGGRRPVATVKAQGYYFTEKPVPVDDMRLSPDGRWIAAQTSEQLYLLPRPADPAAVVDLTAPGNPARRVTDMGADFFDWRADGSLIWTVGNYLQTLPDTAARVPADHVELVAELPRAVPQGRLLLRGGRALTMAGGDRVIADADILVEGDRIAAIGPRGSFAVPAGTPVRDLGGRTVMPGFIDDHDHIGSVRRNVIGYEDWGLRARLAFGVTTAFDPSTLGIDQIAYQDLIDAGLMVGPRLRSTGPALFSKERFTSLDQVRAVLRRYRHAWGLRNIKQYRGESRRVRQWIAIAARELGLLPTNEGSHNPKLILTQTLDGYAGNEHALPTAPFGEDVLTLWRLMRTSYVATLLVNTSGPAGADYFVATRDPARDAKVRRFWPPTTIAQKLAHREWGSLDASRLPALAADAGAIAANGGLLGMGSHGDDPGIGYHYELEAHVMGGMAPMAVLHAATAGAAETIGRLGDMGTLEPGKYADLIVFDRDPLADIRNTGSLSLVMRGGHLFDADTLDELWPEARALPPPWFAGGEPRARWLPVEGE
ncbi:amidohydrolase family protein [Sphingopyxis panaciterrulae]|uniref:Tol biopolymer transport system component n=1 Tax=Sphingopyxis panaciterrulae TaxID=462372 RepID=A0A7W9B722_9SPHN|nr:amidohydrolase family protein [Sphingopyxis panaciterrulae]MBB5707211.1 Tol biopolymer transport system component [Sphingopyxis panaciterrulae]